MNMSRNLSRDEVLNKLPKPSDAVQAMVDGLRAVDERDDFKIKMYQFGHEEDGICFGCAATALCFTTFDMVRGPWHLEMAIDAFRHGHHEELGNYYGVELPEPDVALEGLYTIDWKENIHLYEEYAEQLRKVGL